MNVYVVVIAMLLFVPVYGGFTICMWYKTRRDNILLNLVFTLIAAFVFGATGIHSEIVEYKWLVDLAKQQPVISAAKPPTHWYRGEL